MRPSRKYVLWTLLIFILFVIFIYSAGIFRIGLLSDDYLNFYDATHSSLTEKFSATLPFTNPVHFRPVYYLSLQISSFFHDSFGFSYDNFIFYKIQNLVLYFFISFLAGWIVLRKTGKTIYAAAAALIIILFPNNIHNICWTAGRVDLLCGVFYLGAFYFSLQYQDRKSKIRFALAILFFVLALMTKETAVTLPFIVLLYFYTVSNKSVKENFPFLMAMVSVLIIYLIYRYSVLSPGFPRYYDTGYLSLLLKCLVSLTVPLDYLDLKLLIIDRNLPVIAYLFVISAVILYYLILFIVNDAYKPLVYLILLAIVLIAPYFYVDYIRPQMILIPFTIIVIYLSISLDWLKKLFEGIKVKSFSAILIILMVFFTYYSFNTVNEWLTAYENALPRMEALLNTGLEQNKHSVVIGNAGRLKQSFMFDKLTGAYGYWKYKNFTVKDTINDIVQTGALDEESLNSGLDYKEVLPGEYEISVTGKTQFFYMEGFDDEKTKWHFANKDMSVEAVSYSFFNKPSRIKVKILSQDVNCYLASEMKYYKIY